MGFRRSFAGFCRLLWLLAALLLLLPPADAHAAKWGAHTDVKRPLKRVAKEATKKTTAARGVAEKNAAAVGSTLVLHQSKYFLVRTLALPADAPADPKSVSQSPQESQSPSPTSSQQSSGGQSPPPPPPPPPPPGTTGQPPQTPGGPPVGGAQPSGAPGAPGTSPKEVPFPIEEGFARFKAFDSVTYDFRAKTATFKGNVEIQFQEIICKADEVTINDTTREMFAKGSVSMQQADDIIFGDEAYLNYDTKYFRILNASGNTSGPDVKGHVYFWGEKVEGTFKRYVIHRARITSCEPFCHEDYRVTSKYVSVVPDQKITMHHNYLYIRGQKVMYLPYMILVTKKVKGTHHRSPIQQNYGYNTTEGYFAKFAYTYRTQFVDDLPTALLGVALLNLTQKKGQQYGLRQDFKIPKLGVLTVRGLYGQEPKPKDSTAAKGARNYEVELSQELNPSRSITGNLYVKRVNNYQTYQGIRQNTLTGNFQLNWRGSKQSIAASGNMTSNISSSLTGTNSSTTTQNGSLTYTYNISNRLSFTASQTAYGNKSSGQGPVDVEGTTKATLQYTHPKVSTTLDWKADTNLVGDTTQAAQNKYVENWHPHLAVNLQPSLFGGGRTLRAVSLDLNAATLGQRNETQKGVRGNLQTGVGRTFRFGARHQVMTDFGFQQTIYDDKNARYIISPRITYNYDNHRSFTFFANWGKQQQRGRASPLFRSDGSVASNYATYGGTLSNYRNYKVTLQNSYDYRTHLFGNVTMLTSWDPSQNLGFDFSWGYDIERARFQDFRTTSTYYSPSNNWTLFLTNTLQANGRSGSAGSSTKSPIFKDLTATYYRKYKRNWSGTFYTAIGKYYGGPLIKQATIRKVNSCTTFDFGWRADIKEVFFYVTINAFPTRPLGFVEANRQFWANLPISDVLSGFGSYIPGQYGLGGTSLGGTFGGGFGGSQYGGYYPTGGAGVPYSPY